MKTMVLTGVVLFGLGMIKPSFAGNSSGGGGVGFSCGSKVFLADTYKVIPSKESEIISLFHEKKLLKKAFEHIRNKDEVVGAALIESYKKLQFVPMDSVPLAGDDNINDIPKGCEKIAIAYQDIKSGVVSYNQKFYEKLSSLDKTYLKFHEAFIQLYGGINDTTIIRSLVGNTLISTYNDFVQTLVGTYNSNNVAHACTWFYLKWENDLKNMPFLALKDVNLSKLKEISKHIHNNSIDLYAVRLASVFENMYKAKPTTTSSSKLLVKYLKANVHNATVKDLANVVDLLYDFKGENDRFDD